MLSSYRPVSRFKHRSITHSKNSTIFKFTLVFISSKQKLFDLLDVFVCARLFLNQKYRAVPNITKNLINRHGSGPHYSQFSIAFSVYAALRSRQNLFSHSVAIDYPWTSAELKVSKNYSTFKSLCLWKSNAFHVKFRQNFFVSYHLNSIISYHCEWKSICNLCFRSPVND